MKKLLVAMSLAVCAVVGTAQGQQSRRILRSRLIHPVASAAKAKRPCVQTITTNGVEWTYEVIDGAVFLGRDPMSRSYRGHTPSAVPRETVGMLDIPSTIEGKPVRGIGNYAFFCCADLRSVTIPQSVTNIEKHVFSGCGGLTSITVLPGNTRYSSVNGLLCTKDGRRVIAGVNGEVTIPDGVTSIEDHAFSDYVNLTSITIPPSVTCIGARAFSDCTKLTSITIAPSVTNIGVGAFSGCRGLADSNGFVVVNGTLFDCLKEKYRVTIPLGVTSIAKSVFANHKKLMSVIMPEGVTNIEGHAFLGCNILTSMTIPSSVTSIGAGAFSGCDNLAFEAIPKGVVTIGAEAFKGCDRLVSVAMPTNMTSIEESTFSDCRGLTSVTISKGVTNIGARAFCSCRGLTSVTIPEGVTSIGAYAFFGCRGLTSVTIPEGVTSIGECAFFDCSGLISVTIPTTVTNIGKQAFSKCTGLKSIMVPPSVARIAVGVFPECYRMTSGSTPSNLTNKAIVDGYTWSYWVCNGGATICAVSPKPTGKVSLPSVLDGVSVASVDERVFCGCTNLTSVSIPEGVTSVGHDAFLMSDGLDMNLAFSGCGELSSFVVSSENQKFSSVNGMLCSKDGKMIIAGVNGDVIIPPSVKTIWNGAFRRRANLTSVTIPSSVTYIGAWAFNSCARLSSVKIRPGVTSIGVGAFSGCANLTSVTIPSSVKSIGVWAFVGCHKLTSLTIPPSVTCIGNRAVDCCSGLISATIPTSLTNIVKSAFGREGKLLLSTNGMTTVVFERSGADKKADMGEAERGQFFQTIRKDLKREREEMSRSTVEGAKK